MKKQTIIYLFSLLLAATFHHEVTAQEFSKLDASPMDVAAYPSDYKNSLKEIKIVYSRPQLKGRAISDLAMNGKVWRTGANEASEITLYKDMKLGATLIKAGTYTFYTIPGEKEWTAIISKDLNVWGSYFYNEANDVARISVPVTSSEESLEAFSIVFAGTEQGVDMHLGWGNLRVTVPFTK
jgi:hypothetical protein